MIIGEVKMRKSYIDKQYEARVKTLLDALKLIRTDDFIFVGQGSGEPVQLLENLHTIKNNGVTGCEINTYVLLNDYEFIRNPAYENTIFTNSLFYTSPARKAHRNRNLSFVPNHPNVAVKRRLKAWKGKRIVLLCVCSPMDKHGYLSLSLSTLYERELVDAGAFVIAEVNPNLPRTFGDTMIHISEIDAIVETKYSIPSVTYGEFSETDKKIAENIAGLVEDGSTIQFGIGKIPNAVAFALKDKKRLGIHTDIFTDSMIDLIEFGAVDNSMKTLCKGKTVGASALGTRKLYDFIDDNPSFEFRSCMWINDPYVISQNYKMVSINTSLEVDLTGQCASESIGTMQFSGTGGQANTAIGAQMSSGGKSIIALSSSAVVKSDNGEKSIISKIVPVLKEGAVVSLSRNDVDYVVTEYGVASLGGQSIKERVRRLINIAHPRFREQLKYETEKYEIW